ncbi:MAG TPA: M48 family metallopeptidase [Planctomycetota bacterium]|nr:M48 family metallopeptidase [Planctomycetota bacterium]
MRSPLVRWVRAAALVLLAGCATVPGTGRSQLRFIPLETEMSLGEEGYQSELKEAKLITSGPDYEMVQRVGKRIADAATQLNPEPAAEFEWEIKLIDDPKTVNAWCMPGGKMAVYSGLLPVTQNEEALAIVVGHEVGHAVARHGAERMSQDIVFSVVLGVTATSLSDMKPEEKNAVMAALVGVGTLGVLYPYSRTQEAEADELGLYIAAWAGYDPHAAIPLWQRMSEMGGSKPPELLSTHPSDESRIEHMQELMPQAEDMYEQGKRERGES